ncbi:MAG: AsmA family protein [Rhodospirillales bacterium]|nr:AsmA family protein [Rhodospirillales bacterium]
MNIKASQKEIQLSKINTQFDKSKLSGAATIALRKRLGLGISLSLDRINLNSYLPKTPASKTSEITTQSSTQTQTESQSQTQALTTNINPLASLGFLTKIDANTKLRIGELVHSGIKVRKITLDTTLFKNNLTFNDVRVDDLAGAKISVTGALSKLNAMPQFDNLKVDFKTKSIAALAKILKLDLPIPAKTIGKVSLNAGLNGAILQPTLSTKIGAIGATVTLDGKLSALPTHSMIDADISFQHGNLAKLIKATGSSYQPSGKIGAIKASTHLKGGLLDLQLTNLNGVIGKTKFSGSAQATTNNLRPKLTASLKTGEVTIDPYLPADHAKTTSSSQSSSSSTSSGSSSGSPSNGAPWSNEKIDVSALRDFDANIQINSSALRYGDIRFNNAVMAITLDKGILNAKQVSGTMFGGTINLTGLLDARNVPDIKTSLSVSNMHMGKILSVLSDQDVATGTVLFNSDFAAKGSSTADMVSALNGNGSFDLRSLDVKGSTKGSPLAGLLGIVGGLGQLGAGLSGQSTEGLADAKGAFSITNGVADLKDMVLLSGLGNGNVTGQIDLARWNMDVSGVMHLAQNVLTQLLSLNSGIMQEFPFSVSGSIDDPDINFSTGRQTGSNPALPIIGDVPVLGSVLEGVLGGVLGTKTQTQQQTPTSQTQTDGSSQQAPPPQQNQQQPTQQEIKPQDILKQLLQF